MYNRTAISEFSGRRYLRVLPIYLQLKRLQGLQSVQSCPISNTGWSCAVYASLGISIKRVTIRAANEAVFGYGPSVMATPVGRIGSSPYSLPDLRWRPGRSFLYTGPLNPIVTKVARNGSVPATTVAAGNVTILIIIVDPAGSKVRIQYGQLASP